MSREWFCRVAKVLAICLVFMAPVLTLTAQASPAADEPLFGTWVNGEFGTGKGPQKCVFLVDGREFDYMMMTDKEPEYESKFWITDQSMDQEGNYWYKIRIKTWYYGFPRTEENIFGDGYALVKVDASGTTIESVWAGSRMPDEEDWGLIPHPAFYRQE
jgi:hypothetical protein